MCVSVAGFVWYVDKNAYYTNTNSPHWYSSDVVESENDQHVVNFPSYPEALSARHLKIEWNAADEQNDGEQRNETHKKYGERAAERKTRKRIKKRE